MEISVFLLYELKVFDVLREQPMRCHVPRSQPLTNKLTHCGNTVAATYETVELARNNLSKVEV